MTNSDMSSDNRHKQTNTSDQLNGHQETKPKRNMKLHRLTLAAALTLGLIILINSQTSCEAKKIKLKDLKKIKKYAYLLAAGQKKFYAIPFPFPMPVFVKRQQIYTQIPVVPRYVQQPYHAPSSSASYESSYDHYGAASSTGEYQASDEQPTKQSAAESQRQTESSGSQASKQQLYSSSSALRPTKYLAQLAGVIQGYQPNKANDLVGKLLSGQVKILTPAGLMTSLRGQQPVHSPDADNQTDIYTGGSKHEPGNRPSASELHPHTALPGHGPRRAPRHKHRHQHPHHSHHQHTRDHELRQHSHPHHYYQHPGARLRVPATHAMLAGRHEPMDQYMPVMAGERLEAAQLAAAMAAQTAAMGLQQQQQLEPDSANYLEQQASGSVGSELGAGESQEAVSVEQPQVASADHLGELLVLASANPAAGHQEQLIEQLHRQRQRQLHHQVARQQEQEQHLKLRSALRVAAVEAAAAAAAEKDEIRAAESNAMSLGAHQQLGLPLVPGQLRLLDY